MIFRYFFIVVVAITVSSYYQTPAKQPVEVERTKTLTLPQKCQYLLREPDPDTWNPETDSYPPNLEWENCMGVGRK